MAVTIYHNPRCSKSRQTLELLRERGIETRVIEYLKTPPDKSTLKSLLHKLDISARELIRTNEKEYKEAGLENMSLTEDELIDALISYPKLIQRPIVINGSQAAIGRPPENVLKIL